MNVMSALLGREPEINTVLLLPSFLFPLLHCSGSDRRGGLVFFECYMLTCPFAAVFMPDETLN